MSGDVAPIAELHVPGTQDEQFAAPLALHLPAAHDKQTDNDVAADMPLAVPAEHGTHIADPNPLFHVPGSHAEHDDMPESGETEK